MKIDIALVDDHIMLRNGLAELLESRDFNVLLEASNGKEFIEKLDEKHLPKVVLMDISMPEMDGFETTIWLRKNYPSIQVIALSMFDSETNIIKMLRCGAKAYLLKNSNAKELVIAINDVATKGFYYSDLVSNKMAKVIIEKDNNTTRDDTFNKLNDKEILFLKWCCSELGYKEIAAEMGLGTRTIDGYRETLFQKLNLHSRIGLAMYAVKNDLIEM
jgi:DNA-binding NarL/FixJ family response regulator